MRTSSSLSSQLTASSLVCYKKENKQAASHQPWMAVLIYYTNCIHDHTEYSTLYYLDSKTNTLTHSSGVIEVSSHNLTGAAISITNTTAVLFRRRANDAITADFLHSEE